VVLIPVFEDPEEQKVSPYRNEDWYEERMSWKWMNTIMRVNSLVQKVSIILSESYLADEQTVIIAYVTVLSLASFPSSARLGDGLKATSNSMEDLLRRYTVREVVLVRDPN